MSDHTLLVNGVPVPRFLYGTAWKEDDTERLTALALAQGFRGIDTANQRKHYHEAGVGQSVDGADDHPGLIDPHMHIESSSVSVAEFARAVVPGGVMT